tara:strand:+ start:702 stop:965 length:264 start_codon:yes stop_codon:yes gene_type:complete
MSVELKPKLDKMYIDLDGPNGNVFYLLATACKLSKQLGFDNKAIEKDMKSGDYLNALKVFDDNFGDFVVLQTENAEYIEAFKFKEVA